MWKSRRRIIFSSKRQLLELQQVNINIFTSTQLQKEPNSQMLSIIWMKSMLLEIHEIFKVLSQANSLHWRFLFVISYEEDAFGNNQYGNNLALNLVIVNKCSAMFSTNSLDCFYKKSFYTTTLLRWVLLK